MERDMGSWEEKRWCREKERFTGKGWERDRGNKNKKAETEEKERMKIRDGTSERDRNKETTKYKNQKRTTT